MGLVLGDMVPLPSWPNELSPQQRSVPSRKRAQVWALPAAVCTASASPVTWVGLGRLVVLPSPSCPEEFCPQHDRVPSLSLAQL